MKEALSSSQTSVPTRSTRHNIPEDAILHTYRRENLKSYFEKKWLSFSGDLLPANFVFKKQQKDRTENLPLNLKIIFVKLCLK
jgi:hypothetical protein